MKHGSTSDTERATELRRVFDESFAIPPPVASGETEQLLAVRIGGDPYAIRVLELTGIVPIKRIVPLPGAVREALGLAGIRGGLVPVYSLAAMLSYDQGEERSGWLALCEPDEPLALAFGELEGYLRVGPADVYAADEGAHTKEFVRLGPMARAMISIPSVVETIKKQAARNGQPKER